jgi:predicted short-subunit dehydrogenase-like oxidoreductase (DUF2520 family)
MAPMSEPHPLLPSLPRLGVVGGGRAAWAIASIWRAAGPLAGFSLRDGSTSRVPDLTGAPRLSLSELVEASDAVAVAVSDSSIASVAAAVSSSAAPTTFLFHLSGSLTSDVFGRSSRAFSLHPLLALPSPGETLPAAGALLVFEGTDDSRPLAASVAAAAGCRFLEIGAAQKLPYHAAAVFASNYVAALMEIAGELCEEEGLDRRHIDPALASLASSAISNWATAAGSARFTGPAARGDRDVVERHLSVLRRDRRELYERLAAVVERAVRCAVGSHDSSEE